MRLQVWTLLLLLCTASPTVTPLSEGPTVLSRVFNFRHWLVCSNIMEFGGCRVASELLIDQDNNELQGVRNLGRVRYGIEPTLGCLELDVSGREIDKHLHKIWVVVKPTHACVAVEASQVRQKHEGGNWLDGLEGGVHIVVKDSFNSELEHDSMFKRRIATVAHREGIGARPKDSAVAVAAI
eukprot:1147856-Pelagomonas_calceolata.AAC.8